VSLRLLFLEGLQQALLLDGLNLRGDVRAVARQEDRDNEEDGVGQ
jgi:hypothetical protein